jgi:pimeloyl-ACP methyl ester carboxylesterase
MKLLEQSEFQEPENSGDLGEALIIHRHKDSADPGRSLVVFVHGLGGKRYGRKATWGYFPKFLFQDFRDLDIGLYEYRTLLRRWKFWESIPIGNEAEDFANLLREADSYENIVLMGLSIGGAVVYGSHMLSR